MTRWLYPFYSLIAGGQGTNGRCCVPIDDEHTWTFGYNSRTDRPYTQEERATIWEGSFFPPRCVRRTYTLKDGYKIDTCLPMRTIQRAAAHIAGVQLRAVISPAYSYEQSNPQAGHRKHRRAPPESRSPRGSAPQSCVGSFVDWKTTVRQRSPALTQT